MYFEWKIVGIPNVRYVASGYEDGIDYSLYEITEAGEYKLLLRVNPLVVDENGNNWWGYPWITTDIVLADLENGVEFFATFEHDIIRDEVISIPDWQKRLPIILFRGHKGDWNVEQSQYVFEPYSLEELLTHAGTES